MDDGSVASETTPEPEGPPPKPYSAADFGVEPARARTAMPSPRYYPSRYDADDEDNRNDDDMETQSNSVLSIPSDLDETNLTLLSSPRREDQENIMPALVLTERHEHRYLSEEDATFYEDRSLEERLHRTLSRSPPVITVNKQQQKKPATVHVAMSSRVDDKKKDSSSLLSLQQQLAQAQQQVKQLQQENQNLVERMERQLHQQQRARPKQSPKSNASDKDDTTVSEVARLTSHVQLLQETNAQLSKENKTLHDANRRLHAEKDDWIESRTTAELREREAKQKCQKLEQELQDMRSRGGRAAPRQDNTDELNVLRTENTSLKRKVQSLKSKLDEANEKLVEVTAKKVGLEAQLLSQGDDKKNSNNKKSVTFKGVQTKSATSTTSKQSRGTQTTKPAFRVADTSSSTASLMNRVDERMETYVSETLEQISQALLSSNSTKENSADETDLADRLGRIREAAERASALKQHRHETAQLVEQHQEELQKCAAKYEAGKKQFIESSKAQFATRCQELKKRMQVEFDKKMKEMQGKHSNEIKRLKEQVKRSSAAASDSIQAAVAQASQQVEREVQKHRDLEARLQRLQEDHVEEKKAMSDQYANELQSLTRAWQDEKNRLLDFIQRECNSVFDRSKSTPVSSPRSVTTGAVDIFSPVARIDAKTTAAPASINDEHKTLSSDIVSPSNASELSRTLRETEEFVQMVLNGGGRH